MKYRGLKKLTLLVLAVVSSTSLANSPLYASTINEAGPEQVQSVAASYLPTQQPGNKGALKPRWVPDKPGKIALDPHRAIAGVFVLKFVEGSHVRLDSNGLSLDVKAIAAAPDEAKRLARSGLDPAKAAAQLAQVSQLLSDYEGKYGFKVQPLFQLKDKAPQGESQFAEKSQLERQAGEELADLDLYYVVQAANFKEIAVQEQLMNQLNAFAIVEQVHPDVPASGAQVRSPDVGSRQSYLDPAPAGLDGRFTRGRIGGRGEGVHFVDVEYDWITDHEDFAPSSNLFWGGRSVCPYDGNGSEHGTAVMGIIAARDNGMGVTGFAPNVSYGLSSVCRPFDYAAGLAVAVFSGENVTGRMHAYVVANAINAASSALGAGDGMLIEQHTPGPGTGLSCPCNCSQWEYVPMEYYQESFDAIRRATARGIIVVEAAANGSQDLDRSVFDGRFNRALRDSQAILVGASGAGDGMVACFSSSAHRIDVYAWGGCVVTLGYGDGASAPPPFNNTAIPRHYTGGFGGTSSASAIVAGAVISVQGARLGAGLPRFLPGQMRDLLVSTGTPQQDAPAVIAARPIGVQPDLRGAFQRSVLPSSPSTGTLVGLNLPGSDYRSF